MDDSGQNPNRADAVNGMDRGAGILPAAKTEIQTAETTKFHVRIRQFRNFQSPTLVSGCDADNSPSDAEQIFGGQNARATFRPARSAAWLRPKGHG
jgi:hypothetical protein